MPKPIADESIPQSGTALRVVSPATQSKLQVVRCVGDEHPTLLGRARIVDDAGERWVPVLRGVVVRIGDRLLLATPEGLDEPVVIGVVDGFARRAEPPRRPKANLVLQADEALTISDARGEPMFDLRHTPEGPTLRVRSHDLTLAVEGKLRLEGEQVELRATAGETHIEATDDVVVRGENIHLN